MFVRSCVLVVKVLLADLAINLRHGLRAMLLRRVALDDFRIGPDQLVMLVFLLIAARLAADVGFNGLRGYVNVYALAADITVVGTLLLSALFTARLAGEPRLLLGFPIVVLAMEPYFIVLQEAFRWGAVNSDWLASARVGRGFQIGLIAWFMVASLVALFRFAPGRPIRKSAGFAIYLLLYLGTSWWLPSQDVWMARPAEDSSAGQQASVADEAAFHAQPGLLEASLAALEPGRPGVPDIYFVGVGAYSYEDVFMKEVKVIDELFRERFDAEGRTIMLVNNPATVSELPLASVTSLARVLRHIGGLMNREEDLLVLYLTSHGSDKHRLSVVNWPLVLRDIDPVMLRRMLDDAGIKWRVLAISACYSGGFIEPLKNEWTLVMTASAANRTSFGCGAESDFTYFGKALFDEELRRTYSFAGAFERARRTIAERERAENYESSDPQIYMGSAMAGKLHEVESRLQRLDDGARAAEESR